MTKHLNAKFQPEILRMKGHFWIFIWVSPRQEAAQEEKSTGFSDEQMTIFPYEMTSKGSQADGSSALCDFPSKYLPHKNLHRNYPDFFQKRSVFLRKTLSLLCLVFKKWCVCVFVCVCVLCGMCLKKLNLFFQQPMQHSILRTEFVTFLSVI